MTGVPLVTGLTRAEAEADARRRNHDTTGPPAELTALLAAFEAYVVSAGHRSRILVARAAQALDELHDELDHAGRLIAEQQVRMGALYQLLPDADGDDSG